MAPWQLDNEVFQCPALHLHQPLAAIKEIIMKEFFLKTIKKFQKFSQKLDNTTLLIDQKWVIIDKDDNSKLTYIFRANKDLLISKNGLVEKGKWDCIDKETLLIETKVQSYLYKNGFFDDTLLALKIDGKKDFAIFVNESLHLKEINSLEDVSSFLENKYGDLISTNSFLESGNNLGFIESTFIESKKSKSVLLKNEEYLIEYKDGIKGKIYHNKAADFWYFKKYSFSKLKQIYRNKESCIQSLYHFKKTGKILENDFIKEKY